MSVQKFFTQEILLRKTGQLTIPVFLTIGSIVAFLGYGFGIFISQIAGFPAPYEYAGLVGYEAAALFGGMFGAACASLCFIFFWLKGLGLRPWMMGVYTLVWLVSLGALRYTDQVFQNTAIVYVLFPIIIISLVITAFLLRNNK